MPLPVRAICYYFSDPERNTQWRDRDFTAYKLVKAVKGEAINGYFQLKIDNQTHRFDNTNAGEAVALGAQALAKRIADAVREPMVLVPIPNSHVTATVADFRVLQFAQLVARFLGGRAQVRTLLKWDRPMVQAHVGGERDPRVLLQRLVLAGQPDRLPHVLIDDVCTSGGHFIAAAAKLQSVGADVVLGASFARTTDNQHDRMIGPIDFELIHNLLGDDPFAFF